MIPILVEDQLCILLDLVGLSRECENEAPVPALCAANKNWALKGFASESIGTSSKVFVDHSEVKGYTYDYLAVGLCRKTGDTEYGADAQCSHRIENMLIYGIVLSSSVRRNSEAFSSPEVLSGIGLRQLLRHAA